MLSFSKKKNPAVYSSSYRHTHKQSDILLVLYIDYVPYFTSFLFVNNSSNDINIIWIKFDQVIPGIWGQVNKPLN